MSFCSISRGNKKWTCFTIQELELMCIALNGTKLGDNDPIDIQRLKALSKKNNGKYKQFLWESLRDKFYPFCRNNESCWLDSKDLTRQLSSISPIAYDILNHFTLKPKGTKEAKGWLSTNEIDYVASQYEYTFPNFKYIGCFPSDYYILYPQSFPVDVLDTFLQAAIVFNLDESHQSGSHWVAIFFDIDENTGKRVVEYFDPTGQEPNQNIKRFLRHPYFSDSVIVISKKKHQRGNSECGVYSLYFILERINGSSMKEINEKRIPDGEMSTFRKVLFRPWTPTFDI